MYKQSGFTLVELMIASVIGIFLTASLINLFITTNKSVTLSDALSQNQETGRFAMDYLTRFIRQAGYKSDFTQYAPPILMKNNPVDCATDPNLPICNLTRVITCVNGDEKDACSLNNPANTLGDRLAIPYVADTGGLSCTGSDLNIDTKVANVFWVSAEEATKFELRCRAYDYENKEWIDNNPVSIVNNVESLEFQIGVATNSKSRNANKYINIDEFEADSGLSLDNIRSIKVAILTTSRDELDENKVKSDIKTRQYKLLDGSLITRPDGNIRNIFTNTIELPNLIESAAFN